jgi:hypothetical protein
VEDGDDVSAVNGRLVDPPEEGLEPRVPDAARKPLREPPHVLGAQVEWELPPDAGP